MRKIFYLLSLIVTMGISACLPVNSPQNTSETEVSNVEYSDDSSDKEENNIASNIDEDGSYTDCKSVALYIHTFRHLPSNYITKKEAQSLGWNSSKGNLHDVAPGKSIGGDNFGNYEGLLPKAKKRKYYECDIDYGGGRRNAKRIIYSNDGLVFYTDDHYKTFQQIY